MRYLKKTNEDGMSLVEIMLAVAIFVIGALSVIHLFSAAQISLNYSLEKSQALSLAKEGIEKQRHNRDTGLSYEEEVDNEINLNGQEFVRNVTVIDSDGVWTITSTVEWSFLADEEDVYLVEVVTSWR